MKTRTYGDDWDHYVENWAAHARQEPTNRGRQDLVYPGDEWGDEASWRAHAERFLLPYLPRDGQGSAVEIGPGSGKYSALVVARVGRLLCLDVSEKFIALARERLRPHVEAGRVAFERLELEDCNEASRILARHGLVGGTDLVFSVDSMQHVELHTLIAYLIAAARALRPGGHLSMTFASCATDAGFARLLDEAPWYYGGGRPGHQFYFLSREAVSSMLARLGFEVVDWDEVRDLNLVARKEREVDVTLQSLDER